MIEVKQFLIFYSLTSFVIFLFYIALKLLVLISDGPFWIFGIHEMILVGFIGTFIPMLLILIILPRVIIFIGNLVTTSMKT
ncbi:MAG: hypothetical protein ACFFDS_03495 [Candidatus Thorarchaeota archaeon]